VTFSGDPYRTLGLVPGASLDDVKRAYRRLAKQYHPDAAGPDAVARFLAIQGAYEALAGHAPRGRTQGRAPSRASQADPDRARATREAYRAGRSTGWESRAGAGPARGEDPWRTGTRRDAGGAPNEDRGARPAGPPGGVPGGSSGAGPTSARGASSSGGAQGSGRNQGSGRRAPGDRSAGRKPGRRKATLTSTSYDEAAQEPRQPEWQGSSWYGTSSGTYWTLNPREYADPRKHGPEYQARARRASDSDRSQGAGRPGPTTSASASFVAGDGSDAWSDAGIHAAPGPSPASTGTRSGEAARTAEPSGLRSAGSIPVPSAGSIGLLAGGLAAIPASVIALGSLMDGDLSLAAIAIAAPFLVAALVAMTLGLAGRARS
jgi:curved DNA-binding protein CbpA